MPPSPPVSEMRRTLGAFTPVCESGRAFSRNRVSSSFVVLLLVPPARSRFLFFSFSPVFSYCFLLPFHPLLRLRGPFRAHDWTVPPARARDVPSPYPVRVAEPEATASIVSILRWLLACLHKARRRAFNAIGVARVQQRRRAGEAKCTRGRLGS